MIDTGNRNSKCDIKKAVFFFKQFNLKLLIELFSITLNCFRMFEIVIIVFS